jgi:hypothetical protein
LKVIQGIEKLNIELPDDAELTILGRHPKQILEGARRLHPDVHCNTTYSS